MVHIQMLLKGVDYQFSDLVQQALEGSSRGPRFSDWRKPVWNGVWGLGDGFSSFSEWPLAVLSLLWWSQKALTTGVWCVLVGTCIPVLCPLDMWAISVGRRSFQRWSSDGRCLMLGMSQVGLLWTPSMVSISFWRYGAHMTTSHILKHWPKLWVPCKRYIITSASKYWYASSSHHSQDPVGLHYSFLDVGRVSQLLVYVYPQVLFNLTDLYWHLAAWCIWHVVVLHVLFPHSLRPAYPHHMVFPGVEWQLVPVPL